jgi:multiple sugar transport system substrate-binding protein
MVQDEHGQVAINSRKTVEALTFMKALFEESETPDVLHWQSSSTAKALLAGRISCTMSAISISREAERKNHLASDVIMLSPALRAHSDPVAPPHITQCYVIWNFAQNKEGAKQFLADLVANSLAALQASEFCNFPCFPKTVPDLLNQLSNDPKAEPRGKYKALRDALHWTRNLGHPGYATPAIQEIFYNSLLPRMFAAVAKGEQSAENAAAAAELEVTRIVNQWKQV